VQGIKGLKHQHQHIITFMGSPSIYHDINTFKENLEILSTSIIDENDPHSKLFNPQSVN
jgi:hypothetical protein